MKTPLEPCLNRLLRTPYTFLVTLSYHSDFWGRLKPKDNPVEKIPFMFITHLPGDKKQNTMDGLLAETDMILLSIYAVNTGKESKEKN